jgi:hypothetical protein
VVRLSRPREWGSARTAPQAGLTVSTVNRMVCRHGVDPRVLRDPATSGPSDTRAQPSLPAQGIVIQATMTGNSFGHTRDMT